MSQTRPVARRLNRKTSLVAAVTLLAGGLALAAPPASAGVSKAQTAKSVSQHPLGGGHYLVTFADEPAATYDGTVAGYPRTRPDAGKKLDPTRAEVISWRGHLTAGHDAVLRTTGGTKLADYTVATNGVAVDVTAAQARALAGTAGVVRMEKDAARHLDTTYSPQFLGLSGTGGLWSKFGTTGDATAGKGVIVGVIDSGIWPESPSFAGSELKRDAAGLPVPASGLRGTWFGPCVQGEQFNSQNCNDKLIGARYYVAGFGKQNVGKQDYLSPRDGAGHGSHTSSTAAGNKVAGITIDGTPMGTASGMAPGARLAMYKICWDGKPGVPDGCYNSDAVAAIDDAVANGVDVLNYSVGGSESDPLDVVEQAFRRASNVGIFVANSAGNEGPGASTLDHPSPWLTTVAASTYRIAEQVLQLGDGQHFLGASTTGSLTTPTRLVTSLSVKLAAATATDAKLCAAGTLDPAKAVGKVVQCDRGVVDRIEKSFEVKRVGGVAMVMTNTSPNSLNGDFHAVPTVHVADTARQPILDYITAAGASATAIIRPVQSGESTTQVPEVADFSSRGPSVTTGGDILKPDLAAPGVDVIAAVAPPFNHNRTYDFLSGTSMSSPHVAGLGALLKALHPTWSPAAIKSALMTTARDHATSADPFAQGAGFVRPALATDPGLVFDVTPTDFRRYMVGLGVQFLPPFDTLTALSGSDLNEPSVAIGMLVGTRTVTRTVTNVGSTAETYAVSSSVPGLTVTANPPSFTLAPGAQQAVQLTITSAGAPFGAWAKGTITFTGSLHTVRIPVAVRPIAVQAPADVTGTVASSSTQFTVTPGYTGDLETTVSGLVGVTPISASVTTGPFAPPATSTATKAYPVTVPAGTSLVRFDVDATSNADDLDLYIYKDGELVDLSASESADERVTLNNPEAGTYTAYVNGFLTTGGGAFRITNWVVAPASAGNLTVTPNPTPVTLATPLTLTASWTGLSTAQRWLGVINYVGTTDRTVIAIG